MKIDLRDKIKEEMKLRDLPANDRALFERKLKKELHGSRGMSIRFLSVAASIFMLFAVGYYVSMHQSNIDRSVPEVTEVNLEDYSPELKKIENYYLTAINFELATLEVTDENRAMLDDYLRKLNGLAKEYKLLAQQLTMDSVDEELINNLIDNLQMRLQLMVELKNELKKIKSVNHEENTI
jgi:transposase